MKKDLASSFLFLAFAWIASTGIAEDLPARPPPATEPHNTTAQTNALIDIASQTGLVQDTKTWAAEIADFNNDQRLDILLVRHKPAPELLYINSTAGFVPEEIGLPADRHHCAAADVNMDGRMDSFCSVGGGRGIGGGENNLYLQRPNGGFDDVAAQYGVTDPYGRGRWVSFLNANGDLYPDLFVGNSPKREDEHTSSNRLYINNSGRAFLEDKSFGVNLRIGALCSVTTDFDGDGLDDLIICSEQGLKLYINKKGLHFEDASHRISADGNWSRALLADMNGDGAPDLVTLNGRQLAVHYRYDDRFPQISFTVALTTGMDMAVADADGDGDNDLFVVQFGCIADAKGRTERLDVRDDFLLLNNGHGQFRQMSASHLRPAQGCAGQVVPIDYNADGRSEFLILNGSAQSQGPLQLVQLEKQ